MSELDWFLAVILPNAVAFAMMYVQRKRHEKYRAAIHALLADEGYAPGEAGAIVDELLRASAALGLKEPTLQEFGHALVRQQSFRRAIAHEELHAIYVETCGRSV